MNGLATGAGAHGLDFLAIHGSTHRSGGYPGYLRRALVWSHARDNLVREGADGAIKLIDPEGRGMQCTNRAKHGRRRPRGSNGKSADRDWSICPAIRSAAAT